MDEKPPLKGAQSWSCDSIKFGAPSHISGMAKARVLKFCTEMLA